MSPCDDVIKKIREISEKVRGKFRESSAHPVADGDIPRRFILHGGSDVAERRAGRYDDLFNFNFWISILARKIFQTIKIVLLITDEFLVKIRRKFDEISMNFLTSLHFEMR